MTLRIFEPRYIRMVKESCANDSGFVICMLNVSGDKALNKHIFEVGTYAKIIDFNLLSDGFMSITVFGETAVNIDNIRTESDGLRIGDCEEKAPWCCDIDESDIAVMRGRLQEIFSRYDELNTLYIKPEFEDPIWVIHRWLELIPVDPERKQFFMKQQDCKYIVTFLKSLVLD